MSDLRVCVCVCVCVCILLFAVLMPLYSVYSAMLDKVLWWEYCFVEWATGGIGEATPQ
jgi:hypothetical protein